MIYTIHQTIAHDGNINGSCPRQTVRQAPVGQILERLRPSLQEFGVRWAKGEKFTGGRANDYSSFLEYHSVDGGNERRALHVVFELVAAALGGASKFAASNVRLGSSSRDPGVAPRAEHTGSNGKGWRLW